MANVLVTGASGFVGLALAEHLLARGDRVIGYDLAPPPAAALRAFATLPGRFDAIEGDVRDAERLGRAMRMHDIDRLVLLAAITADAARERAMPQAIFEVNVGGVLAALSAAATARMPRVLLGSSGSVYGASGRTVALLDEVETPQQPEGLYGISKQTAEAAALRLASLHGIDLRMGRLGTCFGPWETNTGVRDTLSAPYQVLQHARAGRVVRLPRDSRRDWLYVRDAAAALTALLDQPSPPAPVYNLAAGFQWSMTQWCEQVAAWHPGFNWCIAQADRDDEEANVSYHAPYDRAPMSNARLLADTGFMPRFDLPAASADFHTWLQTPSDD